MKIKQITENKVKNNKRKNEKCFVVVYKYKYIMYLDYIHVYKK